MEPNLHMIERRERRGKRLASLAMLSVIAFLGAAAFGLFAFLEANAAYGTAKDLEAKYICDPTDFELQFPDLSRLSEVSTVDGVLLGKLTERNSQPTTIDEIPDTVQHALLAAEDAGFYDHEGVDFRGILRAAMANASSSSGLQGGSTITQQVVKNTFLTDEITIERKICEAVVAAELERRYTKEQILEFYMNSVFYGENAYGAKAAAQEYWGKDLEDVTIAEAAAMVVPIRNPSYYNLRNNPENVIRARNNVIEQMVVNEFITPEQGARAVTAPLDVADPEGSEEDLAPQVMIAAREELLNDSRYGLGETFAERKKSLFGCPANDASCEGGGGLKVTVSVNYEWQQEANRMLRAWFQDSDGPTGAIAMIDNRTGALRVMASGLEYGDDIEAGERPYDLVTKGRRQAGSSFKPMALLAGLEHGAQSGWDITLGTYWDSSSPQEIDCGVPCGGSGSNPNIWRVRNAESGGGSGLRSLEEATYRSTNTVYANLGVAVGPENIIDTAHRMGIESPLQPFLSITLGTETVSPYEMAVAYSTIANYGEKTEPYLIERIEDVDGNLVYEHQTKKEQVLDPAMTAAVVRTLEKVVTQGTATRAGIGRPAAGKTGTAQDYRDVWFVGFIPQFTTAVWSGYPDGAIPLEGFTVFNEPDGRPQYYDRAFGGTLPAPIWRQFMEYITDGLPVRDFPDEPEGTDEWFRIPLTEVPDVTGMGEEEAKSTIFRAGLFASIVATPSASPKGTFLGQSPAPGTELPQGQTVTVRYSSGVPPATPNLVGLALSEVQGTVTSHNNASGMNLSWVSQPQPTENQALWRVVISTSPGPGAPIGNDGTITVIYGVPPDGGGGGGGGDGDGDDDGGGGGDDDDTEENDSQSSNPNRRRGSDR